MGCIRTHHIPSCVVLLLVSSYSAGHGNWCAGTLLNRIITAQWEGMGDVGSARYEPALLPPRPTIRVLSYSNCQRSTHPIFKWTFKNLALWRLTGCTSKLLAPHTVDINTQYCLWRYAVFVYEPETPDFLISNGLCPESLAQSHDGLFSQMCAYCCSWDITMCFISHFALLHGRSYYKGRRGSRLICFCPDHGYIPQKTAGQGNFGHFWSLRLVWF